MCPVSLLDRKQGFCLGDAPFVDGWCARDKPALTGTDVGIQPGGVDTYEPNVEGQEIAIDPETAPSGRYVLSSRIGPTGSIRETRTDNNVASTAIELRWPLRRAQELAPLGSCVGEGCAGAVPAAPTAPRRMSQVRGPAARAPGLAADDRPVALEGPDAVPRVAPARQRLPRPAPARTAELQR